MSETGTHTEAPAIRVLLADDHRITLWGLRQLIELQQPRMTVVGTATSSEELLSHPALPETDVLLLDLDLGGVNTADSLADLGARSPARVLVLTAEEDPAVHRDVVARGARGVVHKSAGADMLVRAIERVAAGEIWLDGKLLAEVLGSLTGHGAVPRPRDPAAERIARLTPRERDIVAAMVRLPSAKQLVVADDLGMSEHTLRNHLTTIYDKLELRGRMALYLFAVQHGLERA